ncbi:MAG: hypothetical protein ACD_3C00076G0001 [uncultured bacterium (gcode 4)]|uniref:Putative 3-methyladenine DNA glycosylase n=1 Tax=uncultured bacterium (gcode 4) TaxID=1234023 RepID=K2FB26_9BACT|nr:MAG: hypothetical protein ACD_3C00076G0001 [uncultured bacterium (gcode 4)]
MILNADFFERDTLVVWKELLWKELNYINGDWIRFSWIINEVEVYRWLDDEASHAYIWKTQRNKIMFETFWHVYVYFIYWMYNCMNFTTEHIWEAWAVLIRSAIPVRWIEKMMENRKTSNLKTLTNWPWKLCQAFWINKESYWKKLCLENDIYIEDIWYVIKTPINIWERVWIKKWIDKPWRFWFKA